MTQTIAKLLLDAFEAASHIRSFTAGRIPDEYQQDVMLRSAVERKLTIVGEALNEIRKLDPENQIKMETSAKGLACATASATPTITSTTSSSGIR